MAAAPGLGPPRWRRRRGSRSPWTTSSSRPPRTACRAAARGWVPLPCLPPHPAQSGGAARWMRSPPQPVRRPQQSAAPRSPSPWCLQAARGSQAEGIEAPAAPLHPESTEVQPTPEQAAAPAPATAGGPAPVGGQPPRHDAGTSTAAEPLAAVEPSAARMLQYPPDAVAGDAVLPCAPPESADEEARRQTPGCSPVDEASPQPGTRPAARSASPAAARSAATVSAPGPAAPSRNEPGSADAAVEQAAPLHLPPLQRLHQLQREVAGTAPLPAAAAPPAAEDTTLDVALSADGRWPFCPRLPHGPRPAPHMSHQQRMPLFFLGGNVAPAYMSHCHCTCIGNLCTISTSRISR